MLTTFFGKYFPDSVKNEKEVEFIQLKQGIHPLFGVIDILYKLIH